MSRGPGPEAPILGPGQSLCVSFLGKECPKVTPTDVFGADSGVKKGGLKRAILQSWFLARGWGQQLLSFRSPAVHWMARTSSLNCLSVEILTKPLIHWMPPPFSLKNPFFTEKSTSSHPLPKNRLPNFLAIIKFSLCAFFVPFNRRITHMYACFLFQTVENILRTSCLNMLVSTTDKNVLRTNYHSNFLDYTTPFYFLGINY